MNTSTTGTAQASHMSTAEIKAHIATMFADDRQPAHTPVATAARGLRLSGSDVNASIPPLPAAVTDNVTRPAARREMLRLTGAEQPAPALNTTEDTTAVGGP